MIGTAAESILHAFTAMMIGAGTVGETPVDQFECLAQNIWFETRGGSFDDKIAVGYVVMNRVADPGYPASICEVVWQPAQFSWTQDGESDDVRIENEIDHRAWNESLMAAYLAINNAISDLSNGATHYHADFVSPAWRELMTEVAVHGQHIYYRDVHQPLPRPDDVDESGAIAVAQAHPNDETPDRFPFPHIEPAAGPAEASGPDIPANASGPGSQALDVTDRMRLLGFWHTLRPDLPAM